MFMVISILFCGFSLFSIGYPIMAYRDYTMAEQRPVRVVNVEDYSIPDDAMYAIMELQAYNFSYLGAMEFASYVRRKPHHEWVLVHQDRNIILQLSDVMRASKGMVFQFASVFEDGARVETYFPGRGRIESANYRFQKVKGSPSEALAIHQREINEFFLDHGAPIKFFAIDDVVEQELICNILHAKTRLRPSLLKLVYTTGWVVAFTIMSVSAGFDLGGEVVPLIMMPFVLLGGLLMIWWDRGIRARGNFPPIVSPSKNAPRLAKGVCATGCQRVEQQGFVYRQLPLSWVEYAFNLMRVAARFDHIKFPKDSK